MGQLLRILIIVAVVWLVVHLVRRALTRWHARQDEPADQIPRMLPCAHCGVYVPESQAVFAGGKSYCSEEHSRASRS